MFVDFFAKIVDIVCLKIFSKIVDLRTFEDFFKDS